MNKPNCITAVPHVKEELKSVGRTACASQLLAFLWDKVSNAGMLEQHELRWVAGMGEMAANNAANLAEVVRGVGCLVSTDAAQTSLGSRDGSFQTGASVAELLFTVSNAIEIIGEMTYAASEAAGALNLFDGAKSHD